MKSGRKYILIQPANDAVKELKGCIAPVSMITGIGKGIKSVKAMQKIAGLVFPVLEKQEQIFLTIKTNSNEYNY